MRSQCEYILNVGEFYLCDVSKWFFILNQHLGELEALFGTDPHYVPQQEDPVWSVAHLHKQCIFKYCRIQLDFSFGCPGGLHKPSWHRGQSSGTVLSQRSTE